MLGTDFARTLRAAQAGEEDAFVRLWRDANPAMVRYLRVVGHDNPYDEACECWVTAVRGLPAFSGDELHWRAWVLGCARQRAEESTLRRSWGSVTSDFVVDGDGDIDLDEVLESEDCVDPTHRGIADTLTALRLLPLGQGEVVVLRLGAELPADVVADVVGLDEVSVQRAELRALERLGTETELVSWSLTAPPSRAELADERIAVGAFRQVLARVSAERVKVIAIGTGTVRAAARQARGGPTAPRRGGKPDAARRPGQPVTARRPRPKATTVTGRSRTAVLALTALSLSVVSLGGLGVAASAGVLPTPIQQALHDAVGAPAPGAAGTSSGRQPVAPPTAGTARPTSRVLHPTAASAAAAGLCRAWSTDQAKGTARERSVAYQKLTTAAGGHTKVQAYCATALAPKPSRGAPTASVGGNAKSGSPATPGTGKGVKPGPVTTPGPAGPSQVKPSATKPVQSTKGKHATAESTSPGPQSPTTHGKK